MGGWGVGDVAQQHQASFITAETRCTHRKATYIKCMEFLSPAYTKL